jgi:superfamily II DNA or RNA helicase
MLDIDWTTDAQIREALSVPNPDYEMAQREKLPGWRKMPKKLWLWEQVGRGENAEMVLPRGFLPRLLKGLRAKGFTPTLIDHRTVPHALSGANTYPTLRPDQTEAMVALGRAGSGILQAPAGAGKTVTALDLIVRARTPALVIVSTTNIAQQWRDRAKEHYEMDAGLVGDGKMEIKPLTIALQQTLWSRREEFDRTQWWDQWGMAILDECHHAPAQTYTEILQRFPALYRLGLSATPERKEGTLALAEAVIGPVCHTIDRATLVRNGVLVLPTVIVSRTNFSFPYRPTGYDADGKLRRNNYTEMANALIQDEDRNRQIAEAIVYEYNQGSVCLVVSRRLAHLSYLDELVRDIGIISLDERLMLTGAQDTDRRMEIAKRADQGRCIIFSTIADEALDIPRLDRIFLVWPTRLSSVIEQQIGRIERTHPKKKDAIVYDFFDANVDPLRSQFRLRRTNVYDARGMMTMFQQTEVELAGRRRS